MTERIEPVAALHPRARDNHLRVTEAEVGMAPSPMREGPSSVGAGRSAGGARAEVAHLFRCIAHRLPMQAVEEIEAVTNRGFAGCAHAQPGGLRQILLMDVEMLEAMQLHPGEIKENITTRGLDVRALRPGRRLRIGEALVEITVPCEPCKRMEEIRAGLNVELRGRRGMLCRVLEGGRIRVGDGIEALDYERMGA